MMPEASMMSPVGYLASQDSREGARHEEDERRRRVRHGTTQAGQGTNDYIYVYNDSCWFPSFEVLTPRTTRRSES